MGHVDEPSLWWHSCDRFWNEGIKCPFQGLDQHTDALPDDDEDDRKQKPQTPIPPNEPRIPIEIPDAPIISHKNRHRGNQIRKKLYHGGTPFGPPRGVPVIPEEIEEAIGDPIPDIVPEEPATKRTAAQAQQAVAQTAGAKVPAGSPTSGLEGEARYSWKASQNAKGASLLNDLGRSRQTASATSAVAASRNTGFMLEAAVTAAAATTTGSGGQFGPPSAPAELQSSAVMSEVLLAKFLAKERRNGRARTTPASPTGDAADDFLEKERKKSRSKVGEKVAAIAIAVAAADAIGRGMNSLVGASPGIGSANLRGRGGFLTRDVIQPGRPAPKFVQERVDFDESQE